MSRIDALRNLIAKDPSDFMARYMLANELFKAGDFAEAVSELEVYLEQGDDEGAGYRLMSEALLQLGDLERASSALRQGAAAARAHDHAGMAEELLEKLTSLGKPQ